MEHNKQKILSFVLWYSHQKEKWKFLGEVPFFAPVHLSQSNACFNALVLELWCLLHPHLQPQQHPRRWYQCRYIHEWIYCFNRTSSAQAKRARAAHHLSWVLISRVSSLLFYTKPYQRGLLSTGARASDLYPFMQEPYMRAAAFHGASHEDHWYLDLNRPISPFQSSAFREEI